MAGPVAHRPIAKRHPAAPTSGQLNGVIRPRLGRTQPQVPVQRWGNLVLLLQKRQLVDAGVDRGAARVDGMDLADCSVLDPLAELADRIERMPLIAELRDDLVLP